MIHTSEQTLKAAREILNQYEIKHTRIGTPEPKIGYQHFAAMTFPLNTFFSIRIALTSINMPTGTKEKYSEYS